MKAFRQIYLLLFSSALVLFVTFFSATGVTEETFYSNADSSNHHWLFNKLTSSIEQEIAQEETALQLKTQNPLDGLLGEDFIFQQLIDKKISGVNCLNEAEIEIISYLKFFPEFENHEDPKAQKNYFKLVMLDKYNGKSWPIYSDVPRVGTLDKIEEEIVYSDLPSKNVCSNLQQVLLSGQRSLTSLENTQWGLCNTSCDKVFGVIADRSRELNDLEKLALKICRRDVSTSMLQRAELYGKLGDLFELSFSKDECQFPGQGTISCGHRRVAQVGLLEVKGIDLLAKQQLTITSGSLKRSYWINLDFYVQVSSVRTHRFNMILEYDMGETLLSEKGESLTSTPDCQADVPVGELEFDDVYKRISISSDQSEPSPQDELKNSSEQKP